MTLGFVTVNKATSSELSWISMNTGAIPDRLSSEGRGGHERKVYVVVTYICVIPETHRTNLNEYVKMAWVALGKSFHLCRLKNHEYSKPKPEKKTFSLTEEGGISGS